MALDPPSAARAAIAGWRDGLIAARPDLRPVGEGSLHVTLAFLGWMPERRTEEVAGAVESACRGRRPPLLEPGAVRAVPPKRPRLFALDLGDPRGACDALQASVVDALAAARLHHPERRPFWPHLTLARVKRGVRARPLEEAGSPPGAFVAADVVLYRSTLRPQGALYEPLARMTLR
ncbi:MAG TPA: RNA 2',3'-cyclic phosphodiesterase [Thermoleophilaceae bacterium]|nr:RNA 2',3'-cyclic phosphodiesterase [Thermoleophilaceae bacterium]